MTNLVYLDTIAKGADPTVTGLSILAAPQPVDPNAVLITRADGLIVVLVASPGPPNQAAQNAVLNADLSASNLTAQTNTDNDSQANARFLESTPGGIVLRAAALVTLDRVNATDQTITNLLAAIAAATSLANLQSRCASITAPPQFTPAQIISAITAKIQSGTAN